MKRTKLILIIQIIVSVGLSVGAFIWKNSVSKNIVGYVETVSLSSMYDSLDNMPVIEINCEDDWFAFSTKVNSGESFENCVISLNADLDFSKCNSIVPTGTEDTPFAGYFHGNGYTLNNITISSSEEHVGLFGYTSYAAIRDLNLANCQIISDETKATGGIVGFSEGGSIVNCSFIGNVNADEGSVGGIAGISHSVIAFCTSQGTIVGSTSMMSIGGIACRSGGIAGASTYIVCNCLNYAEVYVGDNDPFDYESGGIVGSNYGTIESCSNYGRINGAGIVNSSNDSSVVRGCFNYGNTYSGIVIHSSGSVTQCVNFGKTTGRYAADIASWCGSSLGEYDYGEITQCLYSNTSGTGAIRKSYCEYGLIGNNFHIAPLSDEQQITVKELLESSNYPDAFAVVLSSEIHRRHIVFCFLITILILSLFFVHGGLFASKKWSLETKYAKAQKYLHNGEHQLAYDLFQQIANYKDSQSLARQCFERYMQQCSSTGIFEIGRIGTIKIQWRKLHENATTYTLISQPALICDCIHSDSVPITWQESDLHRKLNSYYKAAWFNDLEKDVLAAEIRILTQAEVLSLLDSSEQRKCMPIHFMKQALSSNGNVYWWICRDTFTKHTKFPFVTAEGLVSEIGKAATATNIAVRPVITIRKKYEKFL